MWQIVSASKIAQRSKAPARGRGSGVFSLARSVWQIDLVNDRGQRLSVLAVAESNRSECNVKAREERYISGACAVIKKLKIFSKLKPGVVIPPLVLKSLNDPTSSSEKLMQQSARYIQAQGYMAYGGCRSKTKEISYKSLGVVDLGRTVQQQKMAALVQTVSAPFMVMQFIGDGRDMQTAFSSADNPPRLDTALRRAKFTHAVCRLLAFIDFFHRHHKRIILDIKPDNIMLIFDAAGDIVDLCLIDLDGSIAFHSVVMTPKYINQSDFPAIQKAREERNATGLSVGIDYRALANALAIAVTQVYSEGLVVRVRAVKNPYLNGYSHDLTDFKVDSAKFSPEKLPPLQRLLNALKHYDAAIDNTAMLNALFETDHPQYIKTYQQACVDVRRRYSMKMQPAVASSGSSKIGADRLVVKRSRVIEPVAKKMKQDNSRRGEVGGLLIKSGVLASNTKIAKPTTPAKVQKAKQVVVRR